MSREEPRDGRRCLNKVEREAMGKLAKSMLIANLCLWVYFWLAFGHSSEPYDPRPWGHMPVDPYSFWGRAIGLTRSSLTYPFMKATFWIEFPSFLSVALFRKAFLSGVSGDTFFAGISVGGYELLVIMLLSFMQWYIVAWMVQRFWQRWFNGPTTTPSQAPSTSTTR
jgi:hypothetical protein